MHTGELLLQGPVFIKEPSNSVFHVGSEDKKITLNCEARSNPAPHYRYCGKVEHVIENVPTVISLALVYSSVCKV